MTKAANGIGHVKYQPISPLRSSGNVAVLRTHTSGRNLRVFTAAVANANCAAGCLAALIESYSSREASGTVIIDTTHTYLFYVIGNGKAVRYGIGVGREGFTWSGIKSIIRKSEWPDWYPPPAMIARQPYLPRMIAGGPGNPLGARAMYIGGTEYRIHGTNDPSSIGKHISSGCIRMTNDSVIDLYNRVSIGAKVIVLPIQLAHVGQQ